jgi:hypothetical protein
MTRARDISNDQANLGGAVAPYVAGKNYAIGGGFDIWQRGTSFANLGTYAYTADRWEGYIASTYTVTQQDVSSILNNFKYALRAQRNSGSTATNYFNTEQGLETVNIIPLRGNVVTVSFWARCGANFSATSSQLGVAVFVGTGTERVRNVTAFTNETTPINTNATLTTTYQKFTFTSTVIPTNSTQMALTFSAYPNGTAGANDWYEITGVQLEIGSVATPFSRAGGSIGGELALCQRYYTRQTATSTTNYITWFLGMNTSTTVCRGLLQLPVQMRIPPTAIEYGGSLRVTDNANYSAAVSALTITAGESSQWAMRVNVTSTGLTNNIPAFLSSFADTSAYIGFSAEL